MTVAELTRAVAGLLERSFPLVWVAGEISNLARAASGHWYFSLKDREAQVRCVMFRNRNQWIDWSPREGDRVEARALAGLYAPRGEFQLTIEQLRRSGTGALYEAFMRLKDKLQAEGLFDAARKRALPRLPRAIGIVTSLQAAALRDVVSTLMRRAPHVRIVIYPAPVQGIDAPSRLLTALRNAAERAMRLQECEVLLVVRGGGSIEDLSAFNDEALARAVLDSPIPVISGVGHETDFTIIDFVADVRAATPTAAAELASAHGLMLRSDLANKSQLLRRRFERDLAAAEQGVDDLARRLKSPMQRWRGACNVLELNIQRLRRAQRLALNHAQARLMHSERGLERVKPDTRLLGQHIHTVARRMEQHLQVYITAQQAQLDVMAARLVLLDPASALKRGYALATDEQGRIIRTADQLHIGQGIHLALQHGVVDAEVSRIHPSSGPD